ncbi:methyltransferase domain-containing protein [Candidatus Uhrbacteria bacterium]|nr:methyltransferase domain-containing protein [Candidatus Uhrbacteria bacterium]
MQIFFILGSHPALSIAEITAVLTMRQIAWKNVTSSNEALILDVPKAVAIDIAWFGGVIKIGTIITTTTVRLLIRSDQKSFITLLHRSDDARRVQFGVSVYKGEQGVQVDTYRALGQRVGMMTKQALQQQGVSVRFVTSKERVLSSVIVTKEHLLEHGAEFVFIVTRDRVFVGATTAVQAFEEYGARDFGRPVSDARSGMLPPKVAKMMVNLTATSPRPSPTRRGGDVVILDPFCGSGTILQEALLLGYTVIGSDKSPSAIKDAKKNLTWLRNNFPVSQYPSFQVFQSDIRKLGDYVSPSSIDAIVTEPYLGPALRAIPTEDKLKPVLQELTQLYVDAFEIFSRIVKPGGRVVFIFPVFQTTPPTALSTFVLPKITWKLEQTFLYGRPGQKVWREIGIFERKN